MSEMSETNKHVNGLTDTEEIESDDGKIEKPKRPFVMTDKRKEAFEKARLKRAENIAIRKADKEAIKKTQGKTQ